MPQFKVTHYRVRTGEGRRGPERPFSAVLLCDLHNMSYGENNSELLAQIRNENPAVVFVAGDLLTSTREPQMDAALSLLDELTKKYPVYYANGNHEHRLKLDPDYYADAYERYSTMIKSFGVHLLENTCSRLTVERLDMTVWGLELPKSYFRRGGSREPGVAEIETLLGPKPDDGSFHVLLAHHPGYFSSYAGWGADLTLSGHLHGGIVRLPFFGGVISPQMRLFPRYDRGLYTLDGRRLVVSAGLGSHTVNLRINNPPELVVIDFIR